MAKIVAPKDLGVPVPSPAPDPTDHLIVYYGPKGYTPAYSQAQRIDAGAVSALAVKQVGSPAVSYYDDPIGSELPSGIASGAYDFSFTLADANGNEGDFSPPITVTIDTQVPPTLGQPVQLS